MKTRSNMPLFVLECDNVKTLSNSQIDLLRCGDYLVKKDASGEHAYKVTFKSDTGMCLTYHDASVIETQSYDFVDGNWVYNSEDKTPNLLDALVPADITGGTLDNAKPIYCHPIVIYDTTNEDNRQQFIATCLIFNNSPTALNKTTFVEFVQSLPDGARIMLSGGGFKHETKGNFIFSCLYNTSGVIYIEGCRVNNAYDALLLNLNINTIILDDGVNKIN